MTEAQYSMIGYVEILRALKNVCMICLHGVWD